MRIAAAHGSFNSIHQVAPTYTPSNNGLLSPDESALPKGICISIGSSVFAELTSPAPEQEDRHIDHSEYLHTLNTVV